MGKSNGPEIIHIDEASRLTGLSYAQINYLRKLGLFPTSVGYVGSRYRVGWAQHEIETWGNERKAHIAGSIDGREVARLLGLGYKRFFKMVSDGRFPKGFKIPGDSGKLRWDKHEVTRWIERKKRRAEKLEKEALGPPVVKAHKKPQEEITNADVQHLCELLLAVIDTFMEVHTLIPGEKKVRHKLA